MFTRLCLYLLYYRFIEGEALQSLTERVIKWQERANKYLNSYKYLSLSEKFTVLKAKNTYWAVSSYLYSLYVRLYADSSMLTISVN